VTDSTNGMQALAEYGFFMHEDGVMRRGPHYGQMWKPVDGGFLRYDKNGTSEVPMPYKVSEKFRKISGLDFREQPECFDWLWPETEIAKIYIAAKIAQDERAREKGSVAVAYEPPISREKVEAMVEAQEAELPQKRRWFGR
jgi:hypothetical protein